MAFLDTQNLIASASNRRAFLRGAAGLSLAIPGIRVLEPNVTRAQEHDADATPPSGYVGSDPHAQTTGSESPVPTQPQPFALYDPLLPSVQPGTKDITVTAKDATLFIAKDVAYAGWTFDGSIPGKALRVVEGDTVNFTVRVDVSATTSHSVDLHSAKTPPDVNYKTVLPGQEYSWSFTPKYPGAYMYHCGTPPVLMHIGSGMYGAMIVDPKEGWSPAQEFILVQSDFYLQDGGNGVMVPDFTKMLGTGAMDYVVFNGYANQYVENPINVKAAEPIRIFVVNAGPNAWSSFHVVGTIFDAVYLNAQPQNKMIGLQSITIGPGDGACVEFVLDEPGTYAAVNHAFGHAAHGAIALFQAQ
jgi:nitrite reductase (NO-forming)